MTRLSRATIIRPFLVLMALTACGTALGDPWPAGMSFVGLKAGSWHLYVVREGSKEMTRVPTELEVRTKVVDTGADKLAYVGADGSLREQHLDESKGRILLEARGEDAYTQPTYAPGGNQLYVVLLKKGASVDTDILLIDAARDKPTPLVVQRSAQFEPVVSGSTLFYSNVLCTVGCGKIIQEIWRMDLGSGVAEQITLLNSIARQPAVSADGRWVYFSSNRDGYFHIWRTSLNDSHAERITEGNVTDVSPALDDDGNLYFIRRSPDEVRLMTLDSAGAPKSLPLPAGVVDLRDLEISRK